jgi:hypothetical protein
MSSPTTPPGLEKLFADVAWEPLSYPDGGPKPGIPHATHEGILEFMDMKLRVFILNTGDRVVDADDMLKLTSKLFGEPEGEPAP